MEKPNITRRHILSGAAAFTIIKPELVRGAGKEKLTAGLVGCGGRGRQAVVDIMTADERVELHVIGDLFEDKLETNLAWLRDAQRHPRIQERLKVDPDKRFTGFDAYKKVINSDVDIVMLCTPPGWRPIHFEAAVEANKHVFCEKPVGTDATGIRRFMEAARKSEEKKLTVVSGAQRRFQREYVETVDKIRNGEIGDITALYAYWVGTPVLQQKARDPKWADMTWQSRNWYSFVWICGDQIVEQHLHNIDVANWVMGTHPAKVAATGGAVWRPREELYGNIYDHIAADFEYPNGVKLSSYCRQFPRGLYSNIGEMVVGSRKRSNCRDLGVKGENPYVSEHRAMVSSIRGDGPYINHAMTVAESTLTCIMARESAYSGKEITWEMIMNSKQDLMPKTWEYDAKLDVPPLPVPGTYEFV